MTTKKHVRRRRQTKRVTRPALHRFAEIVGFDGASVALNAIEEGRDAKAVMRELKPFIDRYVKAHGEQPNTRRDFYRRLENGEV